MNVKTVYQVLSEKIADPHFGGKIIDSHFGKKIVDFSFLSEKLWIDVLIENYIIIFLSFLFTS